MTESAAVKLSEVPASDYSYRIFNDTTGVPHSFIVISGPNGFKQGYGFAPETEFALFGNGKIANNTNHEFTISTDSISLTPAQYSALAQYINHSIDSPPDYNVLQGQECTNWVYSAINAAYGLSPYEPLGLVPPSSGFWDALGGVLDDFYYSLTFNPYDTQVTPFEFNSQIELLNAWNNVGKTSSINALSYLLDHAPISSVFAFFQEENTSLDNRYTIDGSLVGAWAYGKDISFVANSTTGTKQISGDNFLVRSYTDGSYIKFAFDTVTGQPVTLSKTSGGTYSLDYIDITGSKHVEFTSTATLSPHELNLIENLNGTINSDLAVGIQDYITNSGLSFSESLSTITSTISSDMEGLALMQLAVQPPEGGSSYLLGDIIQSFQDASVAIGNFITNQVGDAVQWFSDANGANIAFAQWLGQNMEALVNGDIDPDEAFIDLSEFVASQYGAHVLTEFIDGTGNQLTAAHKLMATVLVEEFGVDQMSVNALVTNISTALGRFAVDFIAHSGDWDTSDYVAAGITATSSVVAQHYATQIFSQTEVINGIQVTWDPTNVGAANVSGAVAAVANIVSTLLADHNLNTQEWIKLGATTGLAYGTAVTGQLAGKAIASALSLSAGVGGPVGVVVSAIVSILGTKILGGLFGSKKYYADEFATQSAAINSLYTVQTVDDGNGNMVNALVATNAKGSTLILKSGILYAVGGSGSDTLVGDGGGVHQDNVLSGNGGDDYLEGKYGNDTLFGDAGHDHLIGGVGDDLLVGGDGNDEIMGDEGDDTILGDIGDDFIHAGSGNDAITGGDGADIILAGAGVDIVDGGAGNDIIELGEGDDIAEGGEGDDTIMANIGNDKLIGGNGNDQLFGELGNDQLSGGEGSDYLDGGAGVDILNGDNGNDYLLGGLDNDALDGGLGDDRLDAGNGDDILIGGLGNDLLIGGIGVDSLDGGLGDDILVGGFGNDTLNGGDGDDVYYYDYKTTTNNQIVSNGTDSINDTGGFDTIVLKQISQLHDSLSFTKDGNDLIIRYNSGVEPTEIRIPDQITTPTIERLEVADGYYDLTTLDFPAMYGGQTAYPTLHTNPAPIVTDVQNKLNEFTNYQTRKEQELIANSLLTNIGTQTYHEAMRDELQKVYYNGEQIEVFKRSRGIFGGNYSVYKLTKPNSIDGSTDIVSYKTISEYEPGQINGIKSVYSNQAEDIVDIWLDGVIVSTYHVVDGKIVDDIPGASVINYNVPGLVMISAEERFLTSQKQTTYLSQKQIEIGGADQLVGSYFAETINGNAGDDYLYGGGGNDIINGGSGNDWIFGGAGNDTLYGGDGDDVILGGEGNDTIYAGVGNDAVMGGDGDDTIYGEGGNDWLDGGAGNDIIIGGAGNDAFHGQDNSDGVDYTTSTAVSVNLATGIATSSFHGTDILINIYKVKGSDYADTIIGSDYSDYIDGGSGADTMSGGSGDDVYVVDNVADVVTENVNSGIDTIQSSIAYALGTNQENLTLTGTTNITGTGNDLDNVIIGNSGANVLTGNEGNDVLDGGLGNDTMIGGVGNDTYFVNAAGDIITENVDEGIDTVRSSITYILGANLENITLIGTAAINGTGTAGNNILSGEQNTAGNGLYGLAGDDIYIVGAGDVAVENASSGTDWVQASVTYTLGANIENLTLTGANAINGTGNALDNIIIGNDVANTLNGGAGIDTLEGGMGNDIYVVDTTTDIIIENANEGIDTIQSSVSILSLVDHVENITLLTGAVQARGNSLNNVLIGNSAYNRIYGYEGDDFLDGGAGADDLIGGTGNDVYVVDNAAEIVSELFNEGIDTVQSYITYTLKDNFENLTLIGTAAISGTGNSVANHLIGNTANNTLYGLAGNDILDGSSAGVDTLYGGLDDDIYIVNTGDVVIELADEGIDTVQSYITYTLGANLENLTLVGTAAINATGNTGNNIITGNESANIITGGGGEDTMSGGAGNDTYIVDSALDTVIELSSAGTDLVQSSITYTLTDNVENLTLTGTANIDGSGNSLDNVIIGNSGGNTLTGGEGHDTLDGGGGIDTYIGGTGNDVYIIDSMSETIIEDFDEGIDTIRSVVTVTALVSNVENVVLLGTSNLNANGNSLNNMLTGNTGANQLYGFEGNDILDGGAGNDTLVGGLGDDTYVINSTLDVMTELANEGNDTVQSFITHTLLANFENLTLLGTSAINATGNSGDNVINGNSAANIIIGGGGEDTMAGGAGNDTYTVDSVQDVVIELASSGTDLVQSSISYTLTNHVENLTLLGSANLDGTGNGLANVIRGNSGNNTLDGGAGNDTMVGGAGDDIYYVDSISDIVTEGTNAGTDTIRSYVSITALAANVENLMLLGADSINGTGNGLANVITGNAGNNILNGGVGADTMIGGLGNDTYIIDNALDVYIENANEGIDTVQTIFTTTLSNNFENLTLTGTSNINGTGNALDNIITGNTGANQLYGYDGNDTLIAGGGTDILVGGNGNDTYVITAATVTITELANEGIDTVQSSIAHSLSANVENLTLTGTAHINGTGNTLDNVLIGNSGNNTLIAGDGNDTLIGGGGTDVLIGGNGDDLYIVSTPLLTITELSGGGIDTIQSSMFYTLPENVEILILTGASNLNGTGNSINNIIIGNNAENVLSGGDGDDVLNGKSGHDTLFGGLGSDTFVIERDPVYSDSIEDFSIAENDKIDISDLLSGYNPNVDDIHDFVMLEQWQDWAELKIDMNGDGFAYQYITVAQLNNVSGLDLDTMINNGNLII
jgi:Ca2+-binding RTX toxin-like protein